MCDHAKKRTHTYSIRSHNINRLFFRVCRELVVRAGRGRADLKIVMGRARPGGEF